VRQGGVPVARLLLLLLLLVSRLLAPGHVMARCFVQEGCTWARLPRPAGPGCLAGRERDDEVGVTWSPCPCPHAGRAVFFLVCVCARARWGPCEYNELMPAIKPSPWMGLQRQPNTRTNADGWTGRGQCATAQQVGPVSPR